MPSSVSAFLRFFDKMMELFQVYKQKVKSGDEWLTEKGLYAGGESLDSIRLYFGVIQTLRQHTESRILVAKVLKGTVQRKLRGVQNGINRKVLL